MGKTTLSVTCITYDKIKDQKLGFYANGRIGNTEKIDNVQITNDLSAFDFVYALSENMESVIDQSQTYVSVMKELKRFHKKMIDYDNDDEKISGFENCIKGTYDFLYGVQDANEEDFAKNKLFSGLFVNQQKVKVISTNINSVYYISDDTVINLFNEQKEVSQDDKEPDYSPSQKVIKTYSINHIQKNDFFVLSTSNINKFLTSELLTDILDSDYSSDECAWKIISEANARSIHDNMILFVIKVLEVDKVVQSSTKVVPPIVGNEQSKAKEPSKGRDTKGMFLDLDKKDETQEKEKRKKMDKEEEEEKKSIFSNINKPARIKRRMNVYIKRLISIVIVLALMGGIVYGMYNLLTLIFNERTSAEGPTEAPIETPIPTPEPTPEPIPEPEPEPEPEPDDEEVPLYREYTVQSGDNLSVISNNFYGSNEYVDEIVAFNEDITDPNTIRVGQVIRIPFLNVENNE